MKETNPFWRPMKSALHRSKTILISVLLLVGAVLPVMECVFVNLLTSAPAGTFAFLIALFMLVSLHAFLLWIVISEEVKSRAETMLPRAFELEEESEKLARELKRREMTNKLVRGAFDQLNLQQCQIEFSPEPDAWCLQGFSKGLWPIVSPFIDSIDSTLGVRGNKFSIEVYFTSGAVPILGCKNDCHRNLSQLAFYSPHIDNNCVAVHMPTKCSPAQIGFDAEKAFEKHIECDKQLFYENGKPLDILYFRRYATCLINENCGILAEGVIVLTSMQDEPFADDVLETLAFLATIISSYLSAFRRCFEKHNTRHSQANVMVAVKPTAITSAPNVVR